MTITLYNPLMTVAEWIKNLRIHLDLTQTQMAQRLAVTPSTVQTWEYGKHRPSGPAMTLLALLAEQSGFEPPPGDLPTTYGPRRRGDSN